MQHLGGVGKYMSQIQDGLSIQGIWGSTHPCGNIPNVGIIIGRKEKVKSKNLKRETRGPVARRDWQKGLYAYQAPDACMSTLVGFMVGVWVVFGVVVSPVFKAGVPVVGPMGACLLCLPNDRPAEPFLHLNLSRL